MSLSSRAWARWDPAAATTAPGFQTPESLHGQLATASILAYVLCCVAATNFGVAIIGLLRPRLAWRATPWAIFLALPATEAVSLVLIVLPAEDPYTGYGSPMATLLGVVFFGCCGAVLSVPGLVLFGLRVRHWWNEATP